MPTRTVNDMELANREVIDKGTRIANAIMEGGSAGWSTLTGRNVTYTFSSTDYGKPDEMLKAEDRTEAAVSPVAWSGNHSGKLYLVVSGQGAKEIVAYMTALMLGGGANPAETKLDADGMDAYSEAVNSFFGQGIQQARGELGETIKTTVSPPRMVDLTKESPGSVFGATDMLCFAVKFVIEGQLPFAVFLLVERSVTGVQNEENAESKATVAAEKLGVAVDNLATALKIKLPLIVVIATKMIRMEAIQNMSPGTIIEFRKMSGEMLDVMAGNVKIAEAEVVITNQCFGVQIRSLVDPRAAKPD